MTRLINTMDSITVDTISIPTELFDGLPANHCINRIFPEVPLPSNRLYELWGEDKIRQMVRYHHNLLRLSEIDDFLPFENYAFEFVTVKTANFFVDILKRDDMSPIPVGYPTLQMRHFQITVDEHAREVWLRMYKKVIQDMSMPSECIENFWNWIEPFSIRMINRQTTDCEIIRYPYEPLWTDFVEFKHLYRCSS
ncbi:MAG: globin [Campylobacterales bacterium]|nr:globin [Campylobacterales bacterium]